MNIKKLKEIVELMKENDLTEVEIEQEGMKVKVTRGTYGAIQQVVTAPTLGGGKPELVQQEHAGEGSSPEKSNLKEVKAPMVGTFYRAPSPEVEPYVEVGDTVRKGDVLCIVEAMKLMNEVKAEFDGKIVEIIAGNTEPVEFGQTLFLVEPV